MWVVELLHDAIEGVAGFAVVALIKDQQVHLAQLQRARGGRGGAGETGPEGLHRHRTCHAATAS